MNYGLTGVYDLPLVLLSFAIALLASYTSLDLATQVNHAPKRLTWLWILGGAWVMGLGIWSMHFVAMLAFHLPLVVHYDIQTTAISLLCGVLASGLALWLLSRSTQSIARLISGGCCMGGAIAWMHYTGMGAMRLQAEIQYNYWLVGLSIGVGILASGIALRLGFWLQSVPQQQRIWHKGGSAVVLALSISGVHYTGMAATRFTFQPDSVPMPHTLNSTVLAGVIGTATILLLCLTLVVSLLNQWLINRSIQQDTLQASEKQFRNLIREMQVGVFLLNGSAEVIVSNQAAIDLLYLDSNTIEGQVFGENWQLLREDNSPFQKPQLPVQRAITERHLIRGVVVGIDSPQTKTRRWLLMNAEPHTNAENQIEQVICTFSDITQQKQAELALRQAAEQEITLSRVIQRMRQTLDLETIFQATTEELRQAIGCERVAVYQFHPDWSGKFVAESVAPGWKTLVVDEALYQQQTTQQNNCIIQSLNPDLIVKDTYLKETQGGVYSRGVYYRCVPDIYEAGFNPCYLELLEQFEARAYIIVPIYCTDHLWGLLAAYQNSAPRQWEQSNIRIVTQIGTQLGVAVQQAELLAKTRQQAEELGVAKEAADTANRAKSEFLANMSHELRTPLNAILGFAQLMSDDSGLSIEQRDYVDIINRSGEHLLRLINDILEMSKIEAGRTTLQTSDINLHRLLHSLEEMLLLTARTKGLGLAIDYPADLPQWVRIDEGKLRQILINLLGNAIKFTERGSVQLWVWHEAPQPTETLLSHRDAHLGNTWMLHFSIQDTGVGMASHELDQLFQAFRQTQSGCNARQGTGLGLAISQKFVQLMGGEITVSSVPGEGSQFTFAIPVQLTQQTQPSIALTTHRKKILSLHPDDPIYRILVVEDQETNRLLLVTLLTLVGFDVEVAENGLEAITIWENWQPHLIWMDMRMPLMDGYEATRTIRRKEQDLRNRPLEGSPLPPPTVIIALTASAFEEQRQSILDAGCDDLVRKPFQEEELLEKMAQYLNLRYVVETEPSTADLDRIGTSPGSRSSLPTTIEDITPDSLKGVSSDWIAQLHHAAAQGSDLLLLQLIDQLPQEHVALASRLTDLVLNFRFDQIIALAQVTQS